MRSLNYALSEPIPEGADVVLVDGPDSPQRVAAATGKARIWSVTCDGTGARRISSVAAALSVVGVTSVVGTGRC